MMTRKKEIKLVEWFFSDTAADAKEFSKAWEKQTGYCLPAIPVNKWFTIKITRNNILHIIEE